MKKQVIKSNKGQFYIGDICYVLNDFNCDKIWGDIYNYTNGVIGCGENSFIVHNTKWGDGCYVDQYANLYYVDAGVMGVVPIELVDETKLGDAHRLGRIVNGDTAELKYRAGTFHITVHNDEAITKFRIKT